MGQWPLTPKAGRDGRHTRALQLFKLLFKQLQLSQIHGIALGQASEHFVSVLSRVALLRQRKTLEVTKVSKPSLAIQLRTNSQYS